MSGFQMFNFLHTYREAMEVGRTGYTCTADSIVARGTKGRARLGWPFFAGKRYLENYDVS